MELVVVPYIYRHIFNYILCCHIRWISYHGSWSKKLAKHSSSPYQLFPSKTMIEFTEHLSLFCHRLTSKCIMYMPTPISKYIINSPITLYTSSYIPPMILRYITGSQKNFSAWIPSLALRGLWSNLSGA